jgi:hypothetical protein
MSHLPFPQDQLQTFFVSHKLATGSPISDIISAIKKIAELTKSDDTKGMISIGFGKRIIVTANPTHLHTIHQDHLVEIVDYDAYKQVLLIMGKNEPINDVAVHWMIHHAKHEIGAILLIKNYKDTEQISSLINPINAYPHGSILERSKTILKALQKEKILYLEDEGILITGRTIVEIQNQLANI